MLLDQFASRLEHVWRGRYGLRSFEHQKCLLVNLVTFLVGNDIFAYHGLNLLPLAELRPSGSML